MELETIVTEFFAEKNEKGLEVDLKALAETETIKEKVVSAVLEEVEKQPHTCVLIPSYESTKKVNNLGSLINEIALTLQVEALVTGRVENLKRLHTALKKTGVVLIKQSFRTGKELQEQVAAVKAMGLPVSVICLVTHSSKKMEAFGKKNDVPITAIVKLDDEDKSKKDKK
jgi:predicted regulator of amino acid metabolism with ACT domain